MSTAMNLLKLLILQGLLDITKGTKLANIAKVTPISSKDSNRMLRNLVVGLLLFSLTLSAAATSSAPNPKLAPELQGLTGTAQVDVVIQYNDPSLVQASQQQQQQQCSGLLGCLVGTVVSVVDSALNLVGAIVEDVLGNLGIVHALVPANNLQTLANDSNVKYVAMNRPIAGQSTKGDFYDAAVNAPYAWSLGGDGSGIGVAVVDSGVTDRPDFHNGFLGLTNHLVYSQSFVPNNSSVADQYGHGTHVAGIVAGNGSSSTGWGYSKTFVGIAPNANIINLKVLDANGNGSDHGNLSPGSALPGS